MKTENRVGRFTIAEGLFKRWEELLPIMGNFVPIKVEPHWSLDRREIIAYSPLFEVIPDGMTPPEYDLEIAFYPHAPAVIRAHRKVGCEKCGK